MNHEARKYSEYCILSSFLVEENQCCRGEDTSSLVKCISTGSFILDVYTGMSV